MVVHSVIAFVDLRGLQVGQLAKLGIELLLNRLVEGKSRLQVLRRMANSAKDIEHFAKFGLQVLEHALGGFRGLSISNRCNKSHDDLLWKSTAGENKSDGSITIIWNPSFLRADGCGRINQNQQERHSVKVAHFDCFSGISGDMTLGALIDAGVDSGAIQQALASLNLPIRMEVEKIRKGGFAATSVRIEVHEEKSHRFLPEIEEIIGRSGLTERQRFLALRIFRRLAEAEATVHGL